MSLLKKIFGTLTEKPWEETSELLEEGIDVITLPWAKKTEN